MVPAKLSIRNFLCYRECPPLDFQYVRLACLTGENGNGKSALLDAITWALWGKARSNDNSELLSLGQSEMEVEFEFFVGEARYRVIRKYRKTGTKGAGQTSVEFQALDTDRWRPLSGSTVSETQQAIINVLKLTYETFINSAFLVQGRADAFTIKRPAERKQVLADILGLEQYDTYEERAKERRTAATRRVDQLDRQVQDAEIELSKLPDLRAGHAETKAELNEREAEHHDAAMLLELLRRNVQELKQFQADLSLAETERRQLDSALAQSNVRVEARRQEVRDHEAVLGQGEAIRAGYRRLIETREHLSRLRLDQQDWVRRQDEAATAARTAATEIAKVATQIDRRQASIARLVALVADGDALRRDHALLESAHDLLTEQSGRHAEKITLEQQIAALTATIGREEARLQAESGHLTEQLTRLERQAGQIATLTGERDQLTQRRSHLDAQRRRLETLRAEEAEARADVQSLTARNAVLDAERHDLHQRYASLKAAVQTGAADCPLCQSTIGAAELRRIELAYQAEGKQKNAEFIANKERIKQRESHAQGQATEARRLETELERQIREQTHALAAAGTRLAAAEQAATELVAVRDQATRLAAVLTGHAFALPERQQRADLDRQAAALGYDAALHHLARAQVTTLTKQQARYEQLLKAESELAAAEQALAGEQQRQAEWQERHDIADRQAATAVTALAALPLAATQEEERQLTPFEEQHRRLTVAEASLPAVRDALESALITVAGQQRQWEQLDQRIAAARAGIESRAGAADKLPPAEARSQQLADRCKALGQALGGLEQELDRLEEMQRQTDIRRSVLKDAQHEKGIYDDLVRAFGKGGVQALIIDAALPEVETAANDLLARMTNNRMHVTLETQRTTQRGDVKETLDINIADEWGTRPYEMFSGGEAFRINLALRIALSKLLARRAGAPLPTLVIDEGFGSQDAAARERLVEALHTIQDDFQCLLLVTHIDELKDLFETRIEVVKHGTGSIARIVAA